MCWTSLPLLFIYKLLFSFKLWSKSMGTRKTNVSSYSLTWHGGNKRESAGFEKIYSDYSPGILWKIYYLQWIFFLIYIRHRERPYHFCFEQPVQDYSALSVTSLRLRASTDFAVKKCLKAILYYGTFYTYYSFILCGLQSISSPARTKHWISVNQSRKPFCENHCKTFFLYRK